MLIHPPVGAPGGRQYWVPKGWCSPKRVCPYVSRCFSPRGLVPSLALLSADPGLGNLSHPGLRGIETGSREGPFGTGPSQPGYPGKEGIGPQVNEGD